MMKSVAVIVGTRPEAIKLMPVYLALKEDVHFQPILISTGQHKEMLDQIFEFFEVRPDVELNIMTKGQTLPGLTSLLFQKLDEHLSIGKVELIIVQGDTTSSMVGSMLGFYNKIKVAHVEAGLRTYDKHSPFPEEINRRIIGLVADYHFAPTQTSYDILIKEGVDNVFNVGNTVIDSLNIGVEKIEKKSEYYDTKFKSLFEEYDDIVLVTSHRRESFGDEFLSICSALKQIAEKHHILLIYPVHLNPNIKNVAEKELGGLKNIKLIDPLPYDELLFLMKMSTIILTDSGGIQEEAPSLDKPLIVLRNKTERPEGVEAGCAILAGTKKEDIVNAFNKVYSNEDIYIRMSNVKNPYGDGAAAKRICEILKNRQ